MSQSRMLNPDYRYIRTMNFPKIPQNIIDNLSKDFKQYQIKWTEEKIDWNYVLTDTFNEELNNWCKENICDSIYWEFQIITADSTIHRDHDPYNRGEIEILGFPHVKFIYNIQLGGSNVLTEIYDDQETLIDTYHLEKEHWYLFKVDVWHRVVGIELGQVRFAVVGHVF